MYSELFEQIRQYARLHPEGLDTLSHQELDAFLHKKEAAARICPAQQPFDKEATPLCRSSA